MRRRLEIPPTEELHDILIRAIRITALTLRSNVHDGAELVDCSRSSSSSIAPPSTKTRLRLTSNESFEGSHRRTDVEPEQWLAHSGDRMLLARSVVDEFSMRYTFKKIYPWRKYILVLALVMYDLPPVLEVSKLVGVPYRLQYRKAKDGVRVPNWVLKICGHAEGGLQTELLSSRTCGEVGAGIVTSRGVSHLTNMATTCGLTSRFGMSLGRTHTLWPADDPSSCGLD